MNMVEIRSLFAYNHWANRRLLSAACHSTQDFVRDLQSSHSSVRGTLVHIIGGHWVWLRRWLGEPTKEIVARCDELWDPQKFPDVASLETALASLEDEQNSFLGSLTDERVTKRVHFENFQGEIWELSLSEMMQHVVNHSTYHRGQVVTMLRQLGQVPPSTDLSTFLIAGSAA